MHDAICLRISQDCGCKYFITNNRLILSNKKFLELEKLLDIGFSIIHPRKFEKVYPDLIALDTIINRNQLEDISKNFFLAEGYSTATIFNKETEEFDTIIEKEAKVIPIDFKINFKRKTNASEVMRSLSKINEQQFDSGILFSTSGYTEDAKKIAKKYESSINLMDISDILPKLPKKDQRTVKSILELEEITEPPIHTVNELQQLWSDVISAKTKKEKGKTLELWSEKMLQEIEGFKIIDTNIRTDTEEIDLLVSNNSPDLFWTKRSDPILVECKNWNKKVGVKEIKSIAVNLQMRKLNDGILIAINGITGNEYKDALRVILNFVIQEIHITLIDHEDIININNGTHPTDIIRDKFYDLFK